MAELLNNKANILYNNATTSGITALQEIFSTNSTSSTLTVQKTISKGYFKPFDRMTYKVIITNMTDTTLTFNDITDAFTITGGTYANSPFTYVANSGSVLLNDDPGTAPTINQNGTTGNLTITLNNTLAPYATAVLTYMLDIGNSFTATALANTITVPVNGGETITSGPLTTYKEYALLSAQKKAPAIIPTGPFSYTITLTNTGNTQTSSLTIADILTGVSAITSITTQINGGTVQTLPSTGGYYTYTAGTGKLEILKNSDGTDPIDFIIPATNGSLIVTISGTAS
jgi:hypothetical protein